MAPAINPEREEAIRVPNLNEYVLRSSEIKSRDSGLINKKRLAYFYFKSSGVFLQKVIHTPMSQYANDTKKSLTTIYFLKRSLSRYSDWLISLPAVGSGLTSIILTA